MQRKGMVVYTKKKTKMQGQVTILMHKTQTVTANI
jgi:hypothetical protein